MIIVLCVTAAAVVYTKSLQNSLPPSISCETPKLDGSLVCDKIWTTTGVTGQASKDVLADLLQFSEQVDATVCLREEYVVRGQWKGNATAYQGAASPAALYDANGAWTGGFDASTLQDECAAMACFDCVCKDKVMDVAMMYVGLASDVDGYKALCGDYVEGKMIEAGVSAFTAATNIVLAILVRSFAGFERHHTKSGRESSVMIKLFLLLTINSAVIPLLVFADIPKLAFVPYLFEGPYADFTVGWYQDVGQLISTTLLINGLVYPMSALSKGLTPKITRGCLAPFAATQRALNALYEGVEFPLSERYAQLMQMVFTGMVFSGGMPCLLPVAAMFCFIAYYEGKYTILRASRMPPSYDETMAKIFWSVMPACAAIKILLSTWMFSYEHVPSYLNGGALDPATSPISSGSQFNFKARLDRSNAAICVFALVCLVVYKIINVYRKGLRAFFARVFPKGLVEEEEEEEVSMTPELSIARSDGIMKGLTTFLIQENPQYNEIVPSSATKSCGGPNGSVPEWEAAFAEADREESEAEAERQRKANERASRSLFGASDVQAEAAGEMPGRDEEAAQEGQEQVSGCREGAEEEELAGGTAQRDGRRRRRRGLWRRRLLLAREEGGWRGVRGRRRRRLVRGDGDAARGGRGGWYGRGRGGGGEEEAAEGAQAGEEGARASRPRLTTSAMDAFVTLTVASQTFFSSLVLLLFHFPSSSFHVEKTRAASRRARCPPRRTSCDGWRRAPRARTRSASSWLAAVSPGASSDRARYLLLVFVFPFVVAAIACRATARFRAPRADLHRAPASLPTIRSVRACRRADRAEPLVVKVTSLGRGADGGGGISVAAARRVAAEVRALLALDGTGGVVPSGDDDDDDASRALFPRLYDFYLVTSPSAPSHPVESHLVTTMCAGGRDLRARAFAPRAPAAASACRSRRRGSTSRSSRRRSTRCTPSRGSRTATSSQTTSSSTHPPATSCSSTSTSPDHCQTSIAKRSPNEHRQTSIAAKRASPNESSSPGRRRTRHPSSPRAELPTPRRIGGPSPSSRTSCATAKSPSNPARARFRVHASRALPLARGVGGYAGDDRRDDAAARRGCRGSVGRFERVDRVGDVRGVCRVGTGATGRGAVPGGVGDPAGGRVGDGERGVLSGAERRLRF